VTRFVEFTVTGSHGTGARALAGGSITATAMLSPSSSSIHLLLTATVDPRNCIAVRRRNPKARLNDYKNSLRRWLRVPTIQHITFCENSGFTLEELRGLAADDNPFGKSVRFISYRTDGEGCRGKGYGEMGIIHRSLTHGHFIESDLILKVSGRYFIRNAEALLDDIMKFHTYDIVSSVPRHNWVNSECFCASPRFLREFLCPLQDEIDDSRGASFEHLFARAIRDARQAGLTHATFHEFPNLIGISGTYNVPVGLSIVVTRWASQIQRLTTRLQRMAQWDDE